MNSLIYYNHAHWRQVSAMFWIAVFLCMYCIINALPMARLALHQDEVLDWQGQATDTYLVAGRWGFYFFRKFIGEGSFPVCAGLVAGVFIALAVWIQTELFRLYKPVEKILYGVFYMASNQWASMMIYSFQTDVAGVSVFCASLSSYYLLRKQNYWAACLLLTFSLGIYQASGIIFYVLWAAVMLRENRLSWPAVWRFFGICAISVAFYFLILKLFRLAVAIPQETIDYVVGYQKTLSQWGTFSSLTLSDKILFIGHYFKLTVLSCLGVDNPASIACFSAIVPALMLIVYMFRRFRISVALIYSMLVLSIWYIPFIFSLLMGVEMAERVQLAAPARLASLWLLAYLLWSIPGNWRKLVLVLGCVLVLRAAYVTAGNARDEAYEYAHAVQEIKDMHAAGTRVGHAAGLSDFQIILLGKVPAETYTRGLASPYLLNNPTCQWFIDHYRLRNMTRVRESSVLQSGEAYHAMPHWPSLDSVRACGDCVIIKVGP